MLTATQVGFDVFLGPNYGNQSVDTVNLRMPLGIFVSTTEIVQGPKIDDSTPSTALTKLTLVLQTGNVDDKGAWTWSDVDTLIDEDHSSDKIPAQAASIDLVPLGKLTGNYARIMATLGGANTVPSAGTIRCYMSPVIANGPAGGFQDRRGIRQFGATA